jgi:hypothetical protein
MLTLEFNGDIYLFKAPSVRPYNVEGIAVSFCDGKTIYCDDVTFGGGDTCVWWRGAQTGSMVGLKEGVSTKEDYIDYCCKVWLNMVEVKLENVEFYSKHKETN